MIFFSPLENVWKIQRLPTLMKSRFDLLSPLGHTQAFVALTKAFPQPVIISRPSLQVKFARSASQVPPTFLQSPIDPSISRSPKGTNEISKLDEYIVLYTNSWEPVSVRTGRCENLIYRDLPGVRSGSILEFPVFSVSLGFVNS